MDEENPLESNIEIIAKPDKRNTPIDAYLMGDKKRIVEFSPSKNDITIYTIDTRNKVKKLKVGKGLYKDIHVEEYNYGYKRSKETNHFICYLEHEINYYNNDLQKEDAF